MAPSPGSASCDSSGLFGPNGPLPPPPDGVRAVRPARGRTTATRRSSRASCRRLPSPDALRSSIEPGRYAQAHRQLSTDPMTIPFGNYVGARWLRARHVEARSEIATRWPDPGEAPLRRDPDSGSRPEESPKACVRCTAPPTSGCTAEVETLRVRRPVDGRCRSTHETGCRRLGESKTTRPARTRPLIARRDESGIFRQKFLLIVVGPMQLGSLSAATPPGRRVPVTSDSSPWCAATSATSSMWDVNLMLARTEGSLLAG